MAQLVKNLPAMRETWVRSQGREDPLEKKMVWGGRREEGSGWGTHVYLWRIHFDIWQN